MADTIVCAKRAKATPTEDRPMTGAELVQWERANYPWRSFSDAEHEAFHAARLRVRAAGDAYKLAEAASDEAAMEQAVLTVLRAGREIDRTWSVHYGRR